MHFGVLSLLVSSFFACIGAQDLGYLGVPPAGHALWAEVGGGIPFVTSVGNAWQLIKLPKKLWDCRKFHRGKELYAGLSGTAQSPWLFCMHGLLE